jgi:hypothetical protein
MEVDYTIMGRLDGINDTTIWEWKCVGMLSLEHKLQLVIYAWLWRTFYESSEGVRLFKLINIRTGEVLQLDCALTILDDLVYTILVDKLNKVGRLSDADFIRICQEPLPRNDTYHSDEVECDSDGDVGEVDVNDLMEGMLVE